MRAIVKNRFPLRRQSRFLRSQLQMWIVRGCAGGRPHISLPEIENVFSALRSFWCEPWFYLRLGLPSADSGSPRGHRVRRGPRSSYVGPLAALILTLEPSIRAATAATSLRAEQIVQTDCAIRRGSNDTPFFQTARTIAAIFRASVRYAISGRIPRSIIC